MRVLLIAADASRRLELSSLLTQSRFDLVDGVGPKHDLSLSGENYDLVVVDIDQSNGVQVATISSLRGLDANVPILMITSDMQSGQRIAGLDAGADDCLSRPFDPVELRARVRALYRRGHRDTLRLGRLVWDWEHRQGAIDSMPLVLSRYETVLLEALLKSPDYVVPMAILARRIQSDGIVEANNRLYVYISRLRKKLADSGLKIRSSSGMGYAIGTSTPICRTAEEVAASSLRGR